MTFAEKRLLMRSEERITQLEQLLDHLVSLLEEMRVEMYRRRGGRPWR